MASAHSVSKMPLCTTLSYTNMPNSEGTMMPRLMKKLDKVSQPRRPRRTKASQDLRLVRSWGMGDG